MHMMLGQKVLFPFSADLLIDCRIGIKNQGAAKEWFFAVPCSIMARFRSPYGRISL